MRKAFAIAGREMRSYFSSPLAFVVIAIFLLLTGLFFDLNVREYARESLDAMANPMMARQLSLHDGLIRPLYQSYAFFLLMVIPLISMRLLAEEKKLGTAELLLTAPIRTSELVLGKFLGSLGFISVMMLLTAQYPLFLWLSNAPPPLEPFFAAFLGMFLLGAAVLSVGLLMSSLTENQVIAAISALVIGIIFWVIGFMDILFGDQAGQIFKSISLLDNIEDMAKGVLDTHNLVFFLSFIAFNLFLTQRAIESRRWR
ncbi:MAG TPA: ABC transporter permease [Candidatus Saccharimonadales bacterium]|nr:ABC transporter permease [Candidatus Saccharimonadales bacterium]